MTKPGKEPMKMRAVMIPDALWEEAGKMADAQGLSRSELVRRGVMREIVYGRKSAMAAKVREAAK